MRSDILYGIAVADAIGNPLEFMTSVKKADFQRSASAKILRVSDDTQMSMFLCEALLEYKLSVLGGAPDLLRGAYLRWYQTQTYQPGQRSRGGLLDFDSLYRLEAPGRTCMASCRALLQGYEPINNSKGNGTVMRCAPIALVGATRGWSLPSQVAIARLDALTTHKHPFAGDSSVFLVTLYHFMFAGLGFAEALEKTAHEVADLVHPHVVNLVLSMRNLKEYKAQMKVLGGWVAEEALAMAIGSVLHSESFEEAVYKATCIGGDSDTVGSIAGGLAVAAGMPVPGEWVAKLNVLEAMEYLLNK